MIFNLLTKKNTPIFLLILLIIFVPWMISDYFDEAAAAEIINNDLSFYEINPCKVSTFEFLNKNNFNNDIKFNIDNRSSINCYGKISQVILEKNSVQVFVGTNSFVSYVLNIFLLFTFISIFKPDKEYKKNKKFNVYFLITSLLSLALIKSEKSFYEKNFYIFDLDRPLSILFLIILIFFSLYLIVYALHSRNLTFINFSPFALLFSSNITGFNLNIIFLYFIIFGCFCLFTYKKFNKSLLMLYILCSTFWVFNARETFSYETVNSIYLNAAIFNSKNVFIWSLLFYLLIFGIKNFIIISSKFFNIDLFIKNIFISVTISLFFKITAQFNSFIKFVTEINLGTSQDLFHYRFLIDSINAYEFTKSIGIEVSLIFVALLLTINKLNRLKLSNKFEIIFILLGSLSLLVKQHLIIFILFILILLGEKFAVKYNLKFSYFYASLPLIFLNFPISNNLNEILKTNIKTFEGSYAERLSQTGEDIPISFFNFFANLFDLNSNFVNYFSIYNPTFFELYIGSGPLNFNQYFSEIDFDIFLYPHSVGLLIMLFFGNLGLITFVGYYFFAMVKSNKKNRALLFSFFLILMSNAYILNLAYLLIISSILYIFSAKNRMFLRS